MSLARASVDWGHVERVRAVKLDKITHEENFLVLDLGEAVVSFGELDEGFAQVEREILGQFTDIPAGWMASLEAISVPCEVILWAKP